MRIFYAVSWPAGMVGDAGGIRRNIAAYIEMSRKLGHEVHPVTPWDSFKGCDLVHLAPADLEMCGLARELKLRGVPFVVSPILDKVASDVVLQSVTWIDRYLGRVAQTHLGGARVICSLANAICLRSREEERRVRKGLRVTSTPGQIVFPAYPLPSPDSVPFCEKYGDEPFVLFVGNLSNPRKNVLRLIEACKDTELALVLIGEHAGNNYGMRVAAALRQYPRARYLGCLSREMVLSAMSACRVFALPSLMEGIGLAAVEAGALGARLLVTNVGGSADYFGEHVWYVNPQSALNIRSQLRAAWDAAENRPVQSYIREHFDENAVAPQLGRFYECALNGSQK